MSAPFSNDLSKSSSEGHCSCLHISTWIRENTLFCSLCHAEGSALPDFVTTYDYTEKGVVYQVITIKDKVSNDSIRLIDDFSSPINRM